MSLAGYVRDQGEGYFDDVVSGRDVTKSDFQGVTAALRVRPNDAMVIDASVYATKNDSDGQSGQPIVLTTAANALSRDDQVARGGAGRGGPWKPFRRAKRSAAIWSSSTSSGTSA